LYLSFFFPIRGRDSYAFLAIPAPSFDGERERSFVGADTDELVAAAGAIFALPVRSARGPVGFGGFSPIRADSR